MHGRARELEGARGLGRARARAKPWRSKRVVVGITTGDLLGPGGVSAEGAHPGDTAVVIPKPAAVAGQSLRRTRD